MAQRRIADGNAVDRTRLAPAPEATAAAGAIVAGPPPGEERPGPSMFFATSVPDLSGNYDQLARQFYGRNRVPRMRVFRIQI